MFSRNLVTSLADLGGYKMILRVWRGWTVPENAAAYESFLRDEKFPYIHARSMPGFHGIRLLRLDGPEEIEFMTIMRFESIEAIRAFAGERYEEAVVQPTARALLCRFEDRARHYEERIAEV
jgi:heme-degrading monooxygenase HmoA